VDPLLEELIADGILDVASATWARRHQAEHGGAIDVALLELELIDEEGLLRALARCHRTKAAAPSDLENIAPELAKRLPQGFSKSFSLCPVRLVGKDMVALVARPLAAAAKQELRELFGLQVRELICSPHHLAVAAEKVYGVPLVDRNRELEQRLARKRGGPPLERVVSNLARASSFAGAVEELLQFANRLVDFPCLLVSQNGKLRVAVARRGGATAPLSVPLPGAASSLGPAFLHNGYFFGPPAGSDADREFYAALGRELPRCAFVAPVPRARTKATFLYADNRDRGIATRWVAELTLLVGRLGHKSGERPTELAAEAVAAPLSVSTPATPARAQLSSEERSVLERLRVAAAEASMGLVPFVEDLLQRSRVSGAAREPPAGVLMDEMKLLFEKLATDIPAHLARGMQAAFRDMGTTQASEPARVAAAVPAVTLVQTPAAPKETASYQSRRQKTARVKL
jgi:hypothetical protein